MFSSTTTTTETPRDLLPPSIDSGSEGHVWTPTTIALSVALVCLCALVLVLFLLKFLYKRCSNVDQQGHNSGEILLFSYVIIKLLLHPCNIVLQFVILTNYVARLYI
jgi:hypothetical protein